ncbi:MAG: Aldehyde dehydrogenase [Mycobacterium sp.]|nr:Aldehyde dehydrogenase [Mycobacterium sp.]
MGSAVGHGATLVLGGRRIDRPGAYVEPTILTDIAPDNPIYGEGLFGPAAQVYRVASAQAVAVKLECGMAWINHPTSSQPETPFGGIKRSGYGRELGPLGIKEFVYAKLVRTVPRGTVLSGGLLGWCLSLLVGVLPVEPHRLACHGFHGQPKLQKTTVGNYDAKVGVSARATSARARVAMAFASRLTQW